MKVTLISYTPDAAELLIFTKNTRLEMSPSSLQAIKQWPEAKKMSELEYMANTIPSSWAFVDYTFLIEGVSRAFTHQAVRTPWVPFAQQSLRVVDAGDFDFVMPSRFEQPRSAESRGSHGQASAKDVVEDALGFIKESYRRLTDIYGAATEDARSILPTNIATNIVGKYSLRTMSDLAKSRTGGRTQGEYISVVNAMIDCVLAVHPWAEKFLFRRDRNYFDEIEAFAEREYAGDLKKKGELLKIVDRMRAEGKETP